MKRNRHLVLKLIFFSLFELSVARARGVQLQSTYELGVHLQHGGR